MSDPTDEWVLLARAKKFLPPPLGGIHPGTPARWALRGVGNPPVKLETVKIGGRRFVTRRAVEEFVAALSRAGGGGGAAGPTRQQQTRDADAVPDAAGM